MPVPSAKKGARPLPRWICLFCALLTAFSTLSGCARKPQPLELYLPAGPTVMVDGTALASLALDDAVVIRLSDLQQVWPWLELLEDGDCCTFSLRDSAETVSLPCTEVKSRAAKKFDFASTQPGCIRYLDGKTAEHWLPLQVFCDLMGAWLLPDAETQTWFVSGVALRGSAIPAGRQVPVLMYHCISDDVWGEKELFISPDVFRKQMQYLKEHGYEPIFFEDLYHLDDYEKPILITADDGYLDNYTEMYPILQEQGVKVTISLITGSVGNPRYLTAAQIREMEQSGLVSFQSHTVTHLRLDTADAETTVREMAQSRLDVARLTGKIPYLFSCPESRKSQTAFDLVGDYYQFMTTGSGDWSPDDGTYRILRRYICRSMSLQKFAALYP